MFHPMNRTHPPFAPRPRAAAASLLFLLGAAACQQTGQPATPAAPFVPSPPTMPRLTADQYRNSLRDLFGPVLDGRLPQVALEPDTNPYLFYSIGGATTALSEQGTQQYEAAAATLTDALFATPTRRGALLGCQPKATDDGCVSGFLRRTGRRLFRRPLTDGDVARWVAVATSTADGDVFRGVRMALYGMLQSPRFLYRIEVGTDDPQKPGGRRYDGYEMAGRLSFLLWNTSPDDDLLQAAERGDLSDDAGLETQVRRLLDSPRARAAVQSFFDQYLNLGVLSQIERDPALYPTYSKSLIAAMRSEVQLLVDDFVFRRDADIRGLFATRRTFVNRELAAHYGVQAPDATDVAFVPVQLPADGPRAGLLSLGAILTMNAHPTDTSPTLRGKYLRERVLCQLVPPPPGNINLNIDTGGGMPRTLRQRLEEHRKNPACAGCHAIMDPPGFLFENFDSIGAFRSTIAGLPVDASAQVDGETLHDARDLASRLAGDPQVARCLVKQVYRHANARIDGDGDSAMIDELTARFADSGYRVRELLVALAKSDGFRTAQKEVAP